MHLSVLHQKVTAVNKVVLCGEGGVGRGGEGRWDCWCGVECGRSRVTLREFFDISIYCHFIVSGVTALNQTETIQNLHN